MCIRDSPEIAKQMNKHYDKWFEDSLPFMVNEDAELSGHNTFHLMFWKQYGMEVPPVRERKNRKNRKKKGQDKPAPVK